MVGGNEPPGLQANQLREQDLIGLAIVGMEERIAHERATTAAGGAPWTGMAAGTLRWCSKDGRTALPDQLQRIGIGQAGPGILEQHLAG